MHKYWNKLHPAIVGVGLTFAYALSGVVMAEPSKREFVYHNLDKVTTAENWVVKADWGGNFVAEDINYDGVISLLELVGLAVDGGGVMNTSTVQLFPGHAIDAFNFNIEKNSLSFELLAYFDRAGVDLVTGDQVRLFNYGHEADYRWGPETTLTVSPVPEASSFGYFCVGLASLKGFVWLKRRRSQNNFVRRRQHTSPPTRQDARYA